MKAGKTENCGGFWESAGITLTAPLHYISQKPWLRRRRSHGFLSSDTDIIIFTKIIERKEERKTSKKRVLLSVLLAVFAVILAVVIYVAVQAGQNKEQMNLCTDAAIADIGSAYTLTPVDCSEFENLTVYGFMKFKIEQYDAEGLGNLCVMCANGGVMQMLTITLTPAKIDMPLFSVDYMYILGNRTAYVEVYDLHVGESQVREDTTEKLKAIDAQFSELADTTPSSAWYDSLRTAGSYKKVAVKEDDTLPEMLKRYLNEYLSGAIAPLPVLLLTDLPALPAVSAGPQQFRQSRKQRALGEGRTCYHTGRHRQMHLPQGGAACKSGILDDSQVGRHAYGFQSHAGVECGAADADQVLRKANPTQTAAALKQAAGDIRQAVRQRCAAQTGTVGECFLPDSTQPGKVVQPKRCQPITSHEGTASYARQPAVFPYAQLGERGAEGKRTPSDGNDSVRQGYGAKRSASLERPVGYRRNHPSVRRAERHGYRNRRRVCIR